MVAFYIDVCCVGRGREYCCDISTSVFSVGLFRVALVPRAPLLLLFGPFYSSMYSTFRLVWSRRIDCCQQDSIVVVRMCRQAAAISAPSL